MTDDGIFSNCYTACGRDALDRSNELFSIDRETTFFADGRKKPMISKALFFDGLSDGMARLKKKITEINQYVMMPVNDRVGMILAYPNAELAGFVWTGVGER